MLWPPLDPSSALKRDWAVLHAMKAGIPPATVLQSLCDAGLITEQATVADVTCLHDLLCAHVRAVANLIGEDSPAQKLASLRDLCL